MLESHVVNNVLSLRKEMKESSDKDTSTGSEESSHESTSPKSENPLIGTSINIAPNHSKKMVASLSSSLQRSWPRSSTDVENNSSESPPPLMSTLLRSASLASKNGSLDDPADKALIKEMILNQDPNIQGLLNNVKFDGGESLREYIRLVKRNQANKASKLKTSEDIESERKRLEKSMRRAMRKAARVQEKLQRLGASNASTMPPPPPPPSISNLEASSNPIFAANSLLGGVGLPSSFQANQAALNNPLALLASQMAMKPDVNNSRASISGQHMPTYQSNSDVNNDAQISTLNVQEYMANNKPSGTFLQGLNPSIQSQLNFAALSQLNAGPTSTPFNTIPPTLSQIQQTPHLNSLLATQLALNSNEDHVAKRNAIASLLPMNSYLPEGIGARGKRDRPQSMNKLVSFRENNRRNVQPNDIVTSKDIVASEEKQNERRSGNLIPPNLPTLASTISSLSPVTANNNEKNGHQGKATGRKQDMRPDIAINTRVYNKSKNHVSATPRRWTKEEDELLREAVKKHKEKNWKAISNDVPGRNHVQCLQRWRKALDPTVVKGHWTPEEDNRLLMLVAENPKNWGHVARGIPGRTAKQCRERYHNHLDPSIKKGDWTPEEDAVIIEQQNRLGNKWAEISKFLPGRTENSVKIRWKSIQRQAQGSYNARRAKKPGPRFSTSEER